MASFAHLAELVARAAHTEMPLANSASSPLHYRQGECHQLYPLVLTLTRKKKKKTPHVGPASLITITSYISTPIFRIAVSL